MRPSLLQTSLPVRKTAPRTVIVYVTDEGFALPSAASALQVRRLVPSSLADIVIVTVGIQPRQVDLLSSILSRQNIDVTTLRSQIYCDIDHKLFNQTHVPDTSLARFFMTEALPDRYDRILYLDGDVWPCGDLTELLGAAIPQGCLAAAEDQSYFFQNDLGASGRAVRSYFAGLGIDGSKGYFNCGVLLADVPTWKTLAAEAFRFFSENTRLCRFHDQSALNAIVSGRRVRMSPRWNFLSVYRNWDVAPLARAHLIHFAGHIKPWAAADPEFVGLYDTYKTYFAQLEAAQLGAQCSGGVVVQSGIEYNLRLRRKMKTVFLHRKILRTLRFRNLEKTSYLK